MQTRDGFIRKEKSLSRYQEEETGTGQPEVAPAVAVDVEVFGGEMFVWETNL